MRLRSWIAAVTWLVALLAPSTAMAAEAPVEKKPRAWSAYLHVSPAGGTVSLAANPRGYYVWGLAFGYHLPVRTRIAVESGCFYEHGLGFSSQLVGSSPDRVIANIHRIGGELRVGRRAGVLFAYGLVRVGGEFSGVTIRSSRSVTREPGETRFLVSAGGGAQALLGRGFVLGAEPAIDLGVSREPLAYFRLRVYLGGRF